MFLVNDDLSIYATRGDIVCLNVSASDDVSGNPYEFQPGDVVRMKIFAKKDAETIYMQKDFPVPAKTDVVPIMLTEADTKFGDVISKPTDYWYEIELNPYTNPQTIVGYDEDGAKVFKLFPEGKDIHTEEETKPEDIPVVDTDLDLTSSRPVENRAIARAVTLLKNDLEAADKRLTGKINDNKYANEDLAELVAANDAARAREIAVERARVDNLLKGTTADGAEVVDVRVGADGATYATAGGSVRGQISSIMKGTAIKKNAVTPYQASFTSVNPHNLFNIDEAEIKPGYFNQTDTYASPDLFNTVFFKVEPNTLYYTNFVPTQSLNLTFYGASRNVLKHLNTGTYASGTIPACDSEFVVEVGMAVTKGFNLEELVVSKEPIDEFTDKTYFYEMPKFRASYENIEHMIGVVPGRNLFNKDAVRVGYEVYADGLIKKQDSSAVSNYCVIPSGAKVLYLYGLPTYDGGELGNRFSYFYDEEMLPIGNYPWYIARDKDFVEINIPNGAKYFVFSVYQRCPEYALLDYSEVMATTIKGAVFEPYKEAIGSIGGKELAVWNRTADTWATGKTLLIFGDSITETAKVSDDGTEYTEGFRTNWPEYAKGIIGVEKMWNFAKSGGHLKDDPGLEHRQWISNQIRAAINNVASADIVVLSAGTNDSNGKVGTYDEAMAAKTLEELDRTKLYSAIRWAMWTIRATYPEAVCFVATPIQRADRETDAAVVNAIVEMAKRYNFVIIDANTECGIIRENEVWQAEGLYLYDGLHPNKKGAQRMAAYYSAEILHHISTM